MLISVNLTIHNKGFLLERVLNGIWDNMTLPYEFIICFDGCTDDSVSVFEAWNKEHQGPIVKIIYMPDVFETKANNACMRLSSGDYAIIIQDDCIVMQKGFDEYLLKPFLVYDDVFGVSGRAAHNFTINENSQFLKDGIVHDDRWCDLLGVCDLANNNQPADVFAVRGSCNRGPWMVDLAKMRAIGYLDESYNPLDFDEHDAAYRARFGYNWVSGSRTVNWLGQSEWGGTRDEHGNTKPWMYKNSYKNMKLFLDRHREEIKLRHSETRPL